MKTMQAFFSQFETLVEDLPSSIDKLVSMLHQALDAYYAAIQDHGLDSYPAQFWLTVFRMISVETGETGPAEDLLRELIATHAELATAEVSYLHDLADLFFELYKRDINNDDLFQQYLNIAEQYRDILSTFPEMRSVALKQSDAELKLETLFCRCIHSHKGDANPDTISAMHAHGQWLEEKGAYEEARKHFACALSGARKLYGTNDSRTILYQTHLGYCAYTLGYKEEALVNLEEAFTLGTKTTPGRAIVVNQLAQIYRDQGYESRTLKLYQDWCRNNPLSAAYTSEEVMAHLRYAELLSYMGKNHYAIRIAESSARRMNHLFGRDDPDTLYARSVVASLYGDSGDHKRAIRRMKSICENAPAEYRETADYLHTWIKLGFEYALNGNFSKGLQIIDTYSEHFAQHPNTSDGDHLRVMNMKATVHGFLEDLDSSLRIIQDIYTRSVQIHGENHINTLTYENNLAVTCSDLAVTTQDPDKASQLVRLARQYSWDVYKRSASARGFADLFTMLALSNKARLVERSGDLVNAQKMLQRVYDVHVAADPDSPDTLEAMYNLGRFYAENSQFDKAVSQLSQCVQKTSRLLGEHHPDTLRYLKELTFAGYSLALTSTLNACSDSERTAGKALYQDSLSHFLDYLDAMRHRATEAFYIESIENRANYFRDVNEVLGELLRWCENAASLEFDFDAGTIFEHMAVFKNISFDIMLQKKNRPSERKKISLYQELLERVSLGEESLVEELDDLRRDIWSDNVPHHYFHGASRPMIPQIQNKLGNAIFLDVWEMSDAYHVFAIDRNGIHYQTLCDMVEVGLNMLQPLIVPMQQIAAGHERIYLCLHNQSMSYPIAALLSQKLSVPVICLNSITSILNQPTPKHPQRVFFAVPEDPALCCEVQLIEQTHGKLSYERISFRLDDLLKNPMSGILHVSTHGFYQRNNGRTGVMDSYLYSAEGRISANELMTVNMNNVDLVFLSACQSNIGKPFGTFGPYSVSRALQIAGARYTISTLWNVPMVSAIVFADHFYTLLAQGADIVGAFHGAMTCVRKYSASQTRHLMERLAALGAPKDLLREIYMMTVDREYPFHDQIHWAGYVLYQG